MNSLFRSGPASPCLDAADADGALSLSDALYFIRYYFQGGPSAVQPFPGCGPDATQDDLACATHLPCQ
jgi:hypothetical protein